MSRPQPPGVTLGWTAIALAVLVVSFLVSASIGPADLAPASVLAALVDRLPGVSLDHGLSERQADILFQIRLPRVVLGALVGATLAVCGGAYQGVFRNPLADPYLLGAAAGAGFGATLVIAYGPDTSGWPIDALPLAAFVGALVGVGTAYAVGRAAGAAQGTTGLILAGVAVTAFLTAMQTYVQQRESDTIRQVYSWILGRLSTSGWSDVGVLAPYALVSAALIVAHGRLLDVLRVGDDEAQALGAHPARIRLVVVVAASLGTAGAVAVSGLIGFVGLIVPHLVRLGVGTSYRIVLPLSVIGGAAFLMLADVAARTLESPAEQPIGVVTAFFGAPFFALVLWSSRRSFG